jgi:hypothetical protein
MNSDEVKIAKLFCRLCKGWTNQVCISDTGYYVNTACLKCGSIYHFHGSFYSSIKFDTIKIMIGGGSCLTPNKKLEVFGKDDGEGITKSGA